LAAEVRFLEVAFMKEHLKSIIEVLSRDASQLEHHAQKLRRTSPDLSVDLSSDAELIDNRAASIRKQIEILEHWE
jgi:chaperonin cofactor prefoldin